MCGRLGVEDRDEFAQERFSVRRIVDGLETGFDLAPTDALSVVVENRWGERELRRMRWGLLRPWTRPGSSTPINARAESLREKPTFRDLVSRKRCLVPATGYYEWPASGGRNRRRSAFFLRPDDQELFGFAGLYDAWQAADGSIAASFCIVTTAAAESIAAIHPRMPVILRPSDEAAWLDRGIIDERRVLPLLRPYPSDRLVAYPVGPGQENPRAGPRGPISLPVAAAGAPPTQLPLMTRR